MMACTAEEVWDVVVVGGGAMGSSTAYYAAKAGRRTLVLEQYALGGHKHGSSHGGSRITRRSDVDLGLQDLATAALAEWSKLEEDSGLQLLTRCGSLDIGDPLQTGFSKIMENCRTEEFELLTGAEVRQRWPAFAGVPDNWKGVWNKDGGILSPDVIVPCLQNLAKRYGAVLRGNATVMGTLYDKRTGTTTLQLGSGAPVMAKKVVLAAGPWSSALLARYFGVKLPIEVQEVTYGWYTVKPSALQMAKDIPVWRAFGGSSRCYGFPLHERVSAHEMKIAPHGSSAVLAHPGERSNTARAEQVAQCSLFAQRLLPHLLTGGMRLEASTCLYSVTKDANFVLDWLHTGATHSALAQCTSHPAVVQYATASHRVVV